MEEERAPIGPAQRRSLGDRAKHLVGQLAGGWLPTAQQVLQWIRIAIGVASVLLVILLILYGISLLSGIKLRNLLKVLAVPITVGAAVPLLNWLQKKRELEIAERRANDEALQAYLDKMTDLLVTHHLRMPSADEVELRTNPVRIVAWARTKTGLRRLDGDGKGRVLRFLLEAGLIQKGCPRIYRLAGADLVGAKLEGSNLNDSALKGVDLTGADLTDADLRGADLEEADLTDADLTGANLGSANLRGVFEYTQERTKQQIPNEELEQQAKSLEGATMPNGQKYEDWLKDR